MKAQNVTGEEVFAEFGSRHSVDYMLRSVQQNFVQLSKLAEQKASILVGAALILIAVTVNSLNSSQFLYGLLVLSVFTILATIMAVLAIIPHTRCGGRGRDVLYDPLFFGCFSKLGHDEYLRRMKEVVATDAAVYAVILNDIYQHGRVLEKKFTYLSYSYRILLVGLVLSLLVVIGEFVLQHAV